MIDDKQLREIIEKKIGEDEGAGEQSGGSGHLADAGASLDYYEIMEQKENETTVVYHYSVSIETEFTYFPDNPPEVSYYKKLITINNAGKVIAEGNGEYDQERVDKEWIEAKEEIGSYIVKMLGKIEWKFGENRAPVKYPPKFYVDELDVMHPYVCEITEDDEEGITFSSRASIPAILVDLVKYDLQQRYGID